MESMSVQPPKDPDKDRYSRQILYEKIGIEGQLKLARSQVVIFGCGALGTVLANTMVRAGVGHLRLCDRDYIEKNNLQRQVLFDEADVEANLPKAEAAARKLRLINSGVTVEPVVVDVNPSNIRNLARSADLLLDGTDNFETRFLINDLAVESGRPWIYGAVIGAMGLCMPILPGVTPCLRCVFEEAPPPEMNPTCDTAGVLAPAVNIVASFQAIEAIKFLIGRQAEMNLKLMHIDAWTGRVMGMNVGSAQEGRVCPCCVRREFTYLEGKHAGATTTLCGKNAVQVLPASAPARGAQKVNLEAMAEKLAPVATGAVRLNPYMLRASVGEFEITLFPDGRAIIKGTHNVELARSLYARYFGA